MCACELGFLVLAIRNFASTLDNKFSDLRYMWHSVVEMISVHTSFVCMSTELQAFAPFILSSDRKWYGGAVGHVQAGCV